MRFFFFFFFALSRCSLGRKFSHQKACPGETTPVFVQKNQMFLLPIAAIQIFSIPLFWSTQNKLAGLDVHLKGSVMWPLPFERGKSLERADCARKVHPWVDFRKGCTWAPRCTLKHIFPTDASRCQTARWNGRENTTRENGRENTIVKFSIQLKEHCNKAKYSGGNVAHLKICQHTKKKKKFKITLATLWSCGNSWLFHSWHKLW